MKAAWYEKQGAARDVLIVGEMEDPQPRAGEIRIRVAFSGVNPGNVKKREDAFGVGMPYPRVIPHTVMVPAPLMQSAKEYCVNGSVAVSGAMALSPIDHSVPLRSTPWFH